MGRKAIWKEIPITEDQWELLKGQVQPSKYQIKRSDEGLQTNLPWGALRHWFKRAGIKLVIPQVKGDQDRDQDRGFKISFSFCPLRDRCQVREDLTVAQAYKVRGYLCGFEQAKTTQACPKAIRVEGGI